MRKAAAIKLLVLTSYTLSKGSNFPDGPQPSIILLVSSKSWGITAKKGFEKIKICLTTRSTHTHALTRADFSGRSRAVCG